MGSDNATRGDSALLVTGIIRSAHGLDGFVKVDSPSGEVGHYADLTEVLARKSGSQDEPKRLVIEAVEGSSHLLLVKFVGVETPEQAKALSGMELLVPRDKACPLAEGEYYVSDLCKCVLMYKGVPVGTITSVLEGGADDLLEVILTESGPEDSSPGQRRLVPLRKEFVGDIDIGARTVELMHRWILE